MKIGFLITARLKSTRLPYKLLLDLNGRTVVERVIDRAKKVHDLSEVVLCTSTNPQDKPLVDIALANGIYYYNGDEEDVLKRLLDAALFFNLDYFISITADNPLFSIHYANLIVDTLKRTKCDYVKIKGLPLGAAASGLKVKAIKVVCEIKKSVDTEIWGPFIDRPDIFHIEEISCSGFLNDPKLRLTLDYEKDYIVINEVYKSLTYNNILNLYDAMKFLSNNEKVLAINMDCTQKEIDKKVIEVIDNYYSENFIEILKIKEKLNDGF